MGLGGGLVFGILNGRSIAEANVADDVRKAIGSI
jgi:hypothetical protein